MSKKGDVTEVSVSWKPTPRQQITAINQELHFIAGAEVVKG
jgi:hypothetical protein